MLCPACGTTNPTGSRYCRQCGSSLPGAQETAQFNYYLTNSHLPAIDPSLAEAQLRPELSKKLKEASPEPGQRPFCYIHLMGQNYPLSSREDLCHLLDQKWIREDTPAYHQKTGRWYEALRYPQLREKPVSPKKSDAESEGGVDGLLLAAQYGKEAETAAAEGNFKLAISLYEKIVALKVRYPLVKKRLKELRKLDESGVLVPPPAPRQDKSDPSLPWIPFNKPMGDKSLFSEKDRSLFETGNNPSPLEQATQALRVSPFEQKPSPAKKMEVPTLPFGSKVPMKDRSQSLSDSHSTATKPQLPAVPPEPPPTKKPRKTSPGVAPVPSVPPQIPPSPFTSPDEEGTRIDPEIFHLSSGKVPMSPRSKSIGSPLKYQGPWKENDDTRQGSLEEIQSSELPRASTQDSINPFKPPLDQPSNTPLSTTSESLASQSDIMEFDENDVLTAFDELDPNKLNELQSLLNQSTVEVPRKPVLPNTGSSKQSIALSNIPRHTGILASTSQLLQGTVSSTFVLDESYLCCLTADRFGLHVYDWSSLAFLGMLELEEPCKALVGNSEILLLLEHHSRKLFFYELPSLEILGQVSVGPQPEDLLLLPKNRVAVVDCVKARVDIFDVKTQAHIRQIQVASRPFKMLQQGSTLLVFHRDEKQVTQISI
jgi:hypothetical protein